MGAMALLVAACSGGESDEVPEGDAGVRADSGMDAAMPQDDAGDGHPDARSVEAGPEGGSIDAAADGSPMDGAPDAAGLDAAADGSGMDGATPWDGGPDGTAMDAAHDGGTADGSGGDASGDAGSGDDCRALLASDSEPIPFDRFVPCFAERLCEMGTRCRSDTSASHAYTTLCDPRSWPVDPFIEAWRAENPRIQYVEENARSCLQALYGASDCTELERGRQARCHPLFVGTIPEGGDCLATPECVAGAYCQEGTCPGTCVPYGGLGDPCGDGVGRCSSDLTCADGQCALREDECRRITDCPSGYYCDTAGVNTCTPQLAEGEPCDEGGPSLQCQGDLVCHGDPSSEVPVCGPGGEPGEDCTDLSCGPGAFCFLGQCVAASLPGQSCTTFLACPLLYFDCIDGTCQPRPELGQACSGQCLVGVCTGGTCQAGTEPGDSCGGVFDDASCLEGYCDQGTCELYALEGESCTSTPCGADLDCGDDSVCVPECTLP